jgi:hypothetical protein
MKAEEPWSVGLSPSSLKELTSAQDRHRASWRKLLAALAAIDSLACDLLRRDSTPVDSRAARAEARLPPRAHAVRVGLRRTVPHRRERPRERDARSRAGVLGSERRVSHRARGRRGTNPVLVRPLGRRARAPLSGSRATRFPGRGLTSAPRLKAMGRGAILPSERRAVALRASRRRFPAAVLHGVSNPQEESTA